MPQPKKEPQKNRILSKMSEDNEEEVRSLGLFQNNNNNPITQPTDLGAERTTESTLDSQFVHSKDGKRMDDQSLASSTKRTRSPSPQIHHSNLQKSRAKNDAFGDDDDDEFDHCDTSSKMVKRSNEKHVSNLDDGNQSNKKPKHSVTHYEQVQKPGELLHILFIM